MIDDAIARSKMLATAAIRHYFRSGGDEALIRAAFDAGHFASAIDLRHSACGPADSRWLISRYGFILFRRAQPERFSARPRRIGPAGALSLRAAHGHQCLVMLAAASDRWLFDLPRRCY